MILSCNEFICAVISGFIKCHHLAFPFICVSFDYVLYLQECGHIENEYSDSETSTKLMSFPYR